MKRKLIVGGSIGAVVLLVLAMFPTVVGAQTTGVDQKIVQLQKTKNHLAEMDWGFGYFIKILLSLIEGLPVIFGVFMSVLLYLRLMLFGISP